MPPPNASRVSGRALTPAKLVLDATSSLQTPAVIATQRERLEHEMQTLIFKYAAEFFPDCGLSDPRMEYRVPLVDHRRRVTKKRMAALIATYPHEFFRSGAALTTRSGPAVIVGTTGSFTSELQFDVATGGRFCVELRERPTKLEDGVLMVKLAKFTLEAGDSDITLCLLATHVYAEIAAGLGRHGVRHEAISEDQYRQVAKKYGQDLGATGPSKSPLGPWGRIDLLFTGPNDESVAMELKARPAKVEDGDQLLRYGDALRRLGKRDVVLWLVATHVPTEVAAVFDCFGIRHTAIQVSEYSRVAKAMTRPPRPRPVRLLS